MKENKFPNNGFVKQNIHHHKNWIDPKKYPPQQKQNWSQKISNTTKTKFIQKISNKKNQIHPKKYPPLQKLNSSKKNIHHFKNWIDPKQNPTFTFFINVLGDSIDNHWYESLTIIEEESSSLKIFHSESFCIIFSHIYEERQHIKATDYIDIP
jgi:hypothetical protein